MSRTRRTSHQTNLSTTFDEAEVVTTIYNHTGSATARELARELGVSPGTLAAWMRDFPAVKAAVTEMRHLADDAVESSLYKRAVGYEYLETSTSETTGGKDGSKTTETEKTVHVAPDVGAAKFWLSNRRRERWSERQVIEIEGGLKQALDHAAQVLELDMSQWKDVTP